MSTPLLQVREARRGYRGRPVLDGLDLTVEAGRHTALTGLSGAGKSTLVRTIVGLEPLESGAILVGGRPVRSGGVRRTRWLRRTVQLVAQDATGSLDPRHPVSRSIAEPIDCLGLDDDRRTRVPALLELVGLDRDVAGRLPGELSGGQRQRVALARALAARPRLLVGDEMLSGLDTVTRLELVAVLRELAAVEGVTMLLVSHDLGVTRLLCQRLAVLAEGRIVEVGAPEELLHSPSHAVTRALARASRPMSW